MNQTKFLIFSYTPTILNVHRNIFEQTIMSFHILESDRIILFLYNYIWLRNSLDILEQYLFPKQKKLHLKESPSWGTWVALSVRRLPLVQVVITGFLDQALKKAPCSVRSMHLPLPLAHSLLLSLSVK